MSKNICHMFRLGEVLIFKNVFLQELVIPLRFQHACQVNMMPCLKKSMGSSMRPQPCFYMFLYAQMEHGARSQESSALAP